MQKNILQISPINEERTLVLLSIGTNMGNRSENLNEAFRYLNEAEILTDSEISSFYETSPIGVEEQNDFLNAAIIGYTNLSYNFLLNSCKNIEYMIGRQLRERWHEREIDIDIIFYGSYEVWNKDLTIPHPRMHTRKFVLVPSAEVAGDLIHPSFGLTVNELLKNCTDNSKVVQYLD